MFSGGNGGVDTEIRFCLAQNTYPSTVQWSVLGEPGVMRYAYAYYQHVISVEHEESLMSLCGNSFGQFPFANYLNIYIVNSITDSFSNSAVGYSPLPLADEQGNSLTDLDGVVIIHPAVGSENFGSQNMYPVYAEGNILCHEIGHYLRLYHTFQTFGTETDCEGSSDDALNSNYCEANGDFVCDTPPMSPSVNFMFCSSSDLSNSCVENVDYSQFAIPPFMQFADANQTDAYDYFENFMSYTSEDECLKTFTSLQTSRMQLYIEDYRTNLVSMENLISTGVAGDSGCFGEYLSSWFNTSSSYQCTNEPITFNALDGMNSIAASWEWNFGDGTIETSLSPFVTHEFAASGNYEVVLTVADLDNNTSSWSTNVYITECSGIANSQANWLFGNWAGLNFSSGIPVVSDLAYDPYTMATSGVTITQNDPLTGDLLFYSNGTNVWNALGQEINTDGNLLPFSLSENLPIEENEIPSYPPGYIASIPIPNNEGLYRMFVINPSNGNLFYSDIDLNANGGIGYAAPLAQLNTSGFGPIKRIFHVPHCNGIDYWLIATGPSHFLTYLVTSNGLTNADFSSSEWDGNLQPTSSIISDNISPGYMRMYNDQILWFNPNSNGFYFYSFNNLTGIITYSSTYTLPLAYNFESAYGYVFQNNFPLVINISQFELSPLGEYIYFNSSGVLSKLFRYDLSTNEVWAVGDQLRLEIRRGPEPTATQRIYIFRDEQNYVSVVHNPDSPEFSEINYEPFLHTYSPFEWMDNASSSSPDFMDGFAISPSPPSIIAIQNTCNSYSFTVPECYQSWTQEWTFGDGTPTIIENDPTHTYCVETAGLYNVSLSLSMSGDFPIIITTQVDITCSSPALESIISQTNCSDPLCNGSILLLSPEPFSLYWEGPGIDGLTTQEVSNLCAGLYTADITYNESGCEFESDFEIENENYTTDILGSTFTISGNEIWNILDYPDGNVVIEGDLRIAPGANLEIYGLEVLMSSDKKIYVEAGGKLVAKDSKFDGQCSVLWKGIEVRASNSGSIRGWLNAEGCIFTHAKSAIRNHKSSVNGFPMSSTAGGRIESSYCTFTDNQRDLYLTNYSPNISCNLLSLGGIFRDCNFHNENYPGPLPAEGSIIRRIQLSAIGNVLFNNCQIENFNNGMMNDYIMYGIHSTQSQFIWNGCEMPLLNAPCATANENSCTGIIRGFTYGIFINGQLSGYTLDPSIVISKTDFYNYRDITILDYPEIFIIENTMNPQPSIFPDYPEGSSSNYGLYGISVEGLALQLGIAGNTLNKGANTSGVWRNGIVCINTGELPDNYIYDNTISNFIRGIWMRDTNRGSGTVKGLHYECNTFINNQRDVRIDLSGDPLLNPLYKGTRRRQRGTYNITESNPYFSAGNSFVNSTHSNSFDDLHKHVDINTDHHYYYHDNDLNLNGINELVGFITNEVNENRFNQCLEEYSLINASDSEIQRNFLSTHYGSLYAEWIQLVDGGNTTSLTNEIVTTQFNDALELYYELMEKSPTLSEEVMIEAINREYDFPAILLTIILQNNPTAAKSERVNERLDSRLIPLEQWQRDLVNEGLYWVSYKEQLEEEMDVIAQQRFRETLALISSNFQNSNMEESIQLLDQSPFVDDLWLRIFLQLRKKDYSGANTSIEVLSLEHKYQNEVVLDLHSLVQLNILENTLNEMEEPILTQVQLSELHSMVNSPNGYTSIKAKSILSSYGNNYYEPNLNIQEDDVDFRNINSAQESSKNAPTIFPNPADNLLITDYSAVKEHISSLQVVDTFGRIVKCLAPNPNGLSTIQLDDLSPGYYVLRLHNSMETAIHFLPFIKL